MKIGKIYTIATLSCTLIAGCGGGGGDGPVFSSDRSTAQGVYEGTVTYSNNGSVSFNQQTIVLENGEFFIIYGNTYNTVFLLDGFLHGTGEISGNRLYSNDLSDYFFDADTGGISAVYNGTLTATFVPGNSFNGSAKQVDSTLDFSGNAPSASVYDYNTAANLTNVTGSWSMVDLVGNQLTLTIAGSGSFMGSYASGCSLSGTLTPRASGKNIFDATVTFGPTPCTQPNLTYSGIARDYTSSPGARALVFAGRTANGEQGNTLFGIR